MLGGMADMLNAGLAGVTGALSPALALANVGMGTHNFLGGLKGVLNWIENKSAEMEGQPPTFGKGSNTQNNAHNGPPKGGPPGGNGGGGGAGGGGGGGGGGGVGGGTGSSAPKKVPSPNGKTGGPEHQAEVNRIAQDIKSRGLTPVREHRVLTPNGAKQSRYVDIVGMDNKGKVVEWHQVGRQTKGGLPVSRERTALSDIQKAMGVTPQFHPYN